ncbi:MAG: hypothetical protein ACYCUG_14425, partial [Acidimicrobiales bacterium]
MLKAGPVRARLPRHRAKGRGAPGGRVGWLAVCVLLLAGFTALYTVATRGVGADSDGASLLLEGRSI